MRKILKTLFALLLVTVMCTASLIPVFAADVCPGEDRIHNATNCTWVEIGTKEADCETTGTVSGRCLTCNTVFMVSSTPATGHSWETLSGDCTTSTVKKCTNCSATRVIATAEGHEWSAWVVAGDGCERGEVATHTCIVCKYEEKIVMSDDHNWEITDIKEPINCATPGFATYQCGTEGCLATKTEEIWATGNQYHTYLEVVDPRNIEATCFREGRVVKVCTVCKDEIIVTLDRLEHAFEFPAGITSFDDVVELPTCITSGIKAYKFCEMCKQYQYNKTTWTYSKTAAKGVGSYAGAATAENLVITANKDGLVIPAQHDWNIQVGSIAATCVTVGQEILLCEGDDTCNHKVTTKKELIAASGHKYYDELSDAEKLEYTTDIARKWTVIVADPTCKTEAYGEYGCLNAGCTLTKKVVIAEKLSTCVAQESFDAALSTANTCTTDGQLIYRCKYCNDIIVSATVTVPAVGHDLTKAVYVEDNKCKGTGLGYYTCKNTENGVLDCKGALIVCGYEPKMQPHELVELPVGSHTWTLADGSAIIPLTCYSADATNTYIRKCAECGIIENYTEIRPSHDFYTVTAENIAAGNVIEAVKGTCETAAVYNRTCRHTGCTVTSWELDNVNFGLGHKKIVLRDAIAPTCNTVGYKEVWKCTVEGCDKNIVTGVDVDVIVPALHHNAAGYAYSWADVEALFAKAGLKVTGTGVTATAVHKDDKSNNPTAIKDIKVTDTLTWVFCVPETCTTAAIKGGFVCSACNNTVFEDEDAIYAITYPVEDTTSIPMHDFGTGKLITKTCDQYGYELRTCTTCKQNFQLNYVSAGHNFGTPKDYVEPTCVLDGTYTQECLECGFVKTVVIPAAGHYNEAGKAIVDTCLDRTVNRECFVCKLTIPMSHRFTDWTITDNAQTRQCVNCAIVESIELETEPPVTEPVTEPVETETETDVPDTDESETTTDTEALEEEPTVAFEMSTVIWLMVVIIILLIVTIALFAFTNRKRSV